MKYSGDSVSIIMPAFNAGSCINESIDSVQSQTYQDWELLIVDDGSCDNTLDIVKKYSIEDKRIVVISQSNSGPAIARQNAIDNASYRYIAFLDSDDIWLHNKLEKQLDHMNKNFSALSYTQYRRINADNTVVGNLITVPEQISYPQLLKNTAIATSSVIVDRNIVGNIKMTNTYYDDFVLWLDILKKVPVAHGVQEDLMRYRVLDGSVSRNKSKSARMVWKTYREIEGLSFIYSLWYFINYATRGIIKYRKF